MKYNPVSILVMILLLGIVAWMTLPSLSGVELPAVSMSAMGAENVKARVMEIIEEGEIDPGGNSQRYQLARVEILEGDYRGIVMEMDYGRRQVLSSSSVGEVIDRRVSRKHARFVHKKARTWERLVYVVPPLSLPRVGSDVAHTESGTPPLVLYRRAVLHAEGDAQVGAHGVG